MTEQTTGEQIASKIFGLSMREVKQMGAEIDTAIAEARKEGHEHGYAIRDRDARIARENMEGVIASMSDELAAKDAEAAAMRDALEPFARWAKQLDSPPNWLPDGCPLVASPGDISDFCVGQLRRADKALSSNAGADLLARLRMLESRVVSVTWGRLYDAYPEVAERIESHEWDNKNTLEQQEWLLVQLASNATRLRAAEERSAALFGAFRLVQESAFTGEGELRKQLRAAEEKAAALEECMIRLDMRGHALAAIDAANTKGIK